MTEKTALYCRVSTTDQSLTRQRQQTSKYATDQLEIVPAAIEVYSDKQTGTNTDRDGYSEMMDAIENGDIKRVITSEVSRLSRSVRDFADAVERIVDENEVALHVLDMGIDLDAKNPDHYTRAFLSVAATFAELEAEIKRDNIREGIAASRTQGKWHGRPPYGFDVGSEGYLTPNKNHETAVVILDELDKGASKRDLARRAGISRATVRAIDDHRERYTANTEANNSDQYAATETGDK